MNIEPRMPVEQAMLSYGLSWDDVMRSGVPVYQETRPGVYKVFHDRQCPLSFVGLYVEKGSLTSLSVPGKVTPKPAKKATVVTLKKIKAKDHTGYSPATVNMIVED